MQHGRGIGATGVLGGPQSALAPGAGQGSGASQQAGRDVLPREPVLRLTRGLDGLLIGLTASLLRSVDVRRFAAGVCAAPAGASGGRTDQGMRGIGGIGGPLGLGSSGGSAGSSGGGQLLALAALSPSKYDALLAEAVRPGGAAVPARMLRRWYEDTAVAEACAWAGPVRLRLPGNRTLGRGIESGALAAASARVSAARFSSAIAARAARAQALVGRASLRAAYREADLNSGSTKARASLRGDDAMDSEPSPPRSRGRKKGGAASTTPSKRGGGTRRKAGNSRAQTAMADDVDGDSSASGGAGGSGEGLASSVLEAASQVAATRTAVEAALSASREAAAASASAVRALMDAVLNSSAASSRWTGTLHAPLLQVASHFASP